MGVHAPDLLAGACSGVVRQGRRERAALVSPLMVIVLATHRHIHVQPSTSYDNTTNLWSPWALPSSREARRVQYPSLMYVRIWVW